MEEITKSEKFQNFSNYLEEPQIGGQVTSKSVMITSPNGKTTVKVESVERVEPDGQPDEVYIELGIIKDNTLYAMALTPREAYQLGKQIEDYGRELACKYTDFLIAEEKAFEQYCEQREQREFLKQVTE